MAGWGVRGLDPYRAGRYPRADRHPRGCAGGCRRRVGGPHAGGGPGARGGPGAGSAGTGGLERETGAAPGTGRRWPGLARRRRPGEPPKPGQARTGLAPPVFGAGLGDPAGTDAPGLGRNHAPASCTRWLRRRGRDAYRSSERKTIPVRGFGLKYVVLGAICLRAAAHAPICATVTGRSRKAACASPSSNAAMASATL